MIKGTYRNFETLYFKLAKKVFKGKEAEYSKGEVIEAFGLSMRLRPGTWKDWMEWGNTPYKRPSFFSRKQPLKQLEEELWLYLNGQTNVELYHAKGIKWWDYGVGPNNANFENHLVNTYPTFMKYIKGLDLSKPSRNHVITLWDNRFIGGYVFTSQTPCISQLQFFVDKGKLNLLVTQRSADLALGCPADWYQMAMLLEIKAKEFGHEIGWLQFDYGSIHVYKDHIKEFKRWKRFRHLKQKQSYKFTQNT